MSDLNYNFFITSIDELCKKYEGQFVVIKDKKIIGSYRTFEEAYDETVKKEDLGTFLIQFCSKDQSALVNNFYSNNVVFS